jgi:Ca2+-binding RTX toxin-like protein
MSLYRFDTTTNPISWYEWDDGEWQLEDLSLNESLAALDDGTIVLTKTTALLIKTVVFSPTAEPNDDPLNFVKTSQIYRLPDGTVVDGPGEEPDDGIEDDRDDDGSDDDYLEGTDDDDLEHGGSGDDVIDGDDGDDDLFGDQGDDHLHGGQGDDKLTGGIGFDALRGGLGKDLLKGEADDDILDGGGDADKLLGGTGDDELDGGDDSDLLDGGHGDDQLEGGGGDDNLLGGDGADALSGGAGNDNENGGIGDDDFNAGTDAGNDKLTGGAGTDSVSYAGAMAAVSVDLKKGIAKAVAADAGIGVDKLSAIEDAEGSDFDDLLAGSVHANHLDGGAGDDILVGGLGADLLTGGEGDDTFRFLSPRDSGLGAKHDVITDLASGDRIDLSAIDAKAGFTRNDSFTFLGGEAPTGDNANGALWFSDGVLYGSTDADVAPEFEIVLTGVPSLTEADLVL